MSQTSPPANRRFNTGTYRPPTAAVSSSTTGGSWGRIRSSGARSGRAAALRVCLLSGYEKLVVPHRQSGRHDGELDGTARRISVAVEDQRTADGVVDDAIVCVVGG